MSLEELNNKLNMSSSQIRDIEVITITDDIAKVILE
jgi:hypothetical protein